MALNTVLSTVLKTMRPPFLILTLACVFLGACTSLYDGATIDTSMLALVLVGAMSAHNSVNMLNEYHDIYSGLDLKTQRTPFSGGSGALPSNPNIAKWVLVFGVFSLLVTIGIGLYFMAAIGAAIAPIGLVGLVIIITYTQWLNRMPLVCLIAPGLGFGFLMAAGTHLVLTQEYSQQVWLISFIPFFLINNLLLLNQYPDMEADASVGRKTFPLGFGIETSNGVYALFMAAAYALILLYIAIGILPIMSIIAFIPIGLTIFSLGGAIKHKSNIGNFPQYLASNVAASILTPFLLGISLLIN
jgi:1,4-dihydroxy-2-naphthoate octaprenyltransferase